MSMTTKMFGVLIATLAIMSMPAAAAQADPFGLQIDNAVLNLGSLSGVKAIDSQLTPPDPPATLNGTITGGDVEVPKAGFVFPPKVAEVGAGISATINMEANDDIVGTFDSATGKMVLDASLKATVDVAGAHCVISPIELQLSSDNAEPYLGVEFGTGLSGTGAIGAEWDSLPAVDGTGFCPTVGQLIAGPGGIWMSQGIPTPSTCESAPNNIRCGSPAVKAPTAAPELSGGPIVSTESTSADFKFTKGKTETEDVTGFQCSIDGTAFEACDSGSKSYAGLAVGDHTFKVKSSNSVGTGPEATNNWKVIKKDEPVGTPKLGALKIKPKNKAVKRGKKATFKVKVKNVGDATAEGVKICVKAPKKLVKVKKCVKIGNLAAGKTGTAKFKVKVSKKAKKGKKATLKFKATSKNAGAKSAKAKVKVK